MTIEKLDYKGHVVLMVGDQNTDCAKKYWRFKNSWGVE